MNRNGALDQALGANVTASAIGTLIGALPGAGADIAAWIAYAVSKRFYSVFPATRSPRSLSAY